MAVKMMNKAARRHWRLGRKLVRTFLAFLAALSVIGAAVMEARASVTLVRFEAKWQDDGTILVVWETSSEPDSRAFFLYRAASASGPWTEYVDFEPSTGDSDAGATYTFVDDDVSQDASYFYRLEEVGEDGSSQFYGPVPATTTRPTPATSQPEQSPPTSQPEQGSPSPTASPQHTGTPRSTAPAQAKPTGALTPLVTTPTPIGGVVLSTATSIPTATTSPTATPEPIEPTGTSAGAEPPTPSTSPQAQAPSPAAQQLASGSKGTSQPLLDASAAQITPEPTATTSANGAPDSRLVLLLGGGALSAAAALAALAVLISRRRAG